MQSSVPLTMCGRQAFATRIGTVSGPKSRGLSLRVKFRYQEVSVGESQNDNGRRD
jgi:hypothetical protein